MRLFDHRAYEVYCEDEQYATLNICPSCHGDGHHGFDEAGCVYSCYACGETGNYFPVSEAMPQ